MPAWQGKATWPSRSPASRQAEMTLPSQRAPRGAPTRISSGRKSGSPSRSDVVLRGAGAPGLTLAGLSRFLGGSGFAYSRVVDTDTTGLHSDSPDGLVTFSRNRCSVRGSKPSTTCLVAYPLDGETHGHEVTESVSFVSHLGWCILKAVYSTAELTLAAVSLPHWTGRASGTKGRSRVAPPRLPACLSRQCSPSVTRSGHAMLHSGETTVFARDVCPHFTKAHA